MDISLGIFLFVVLIFAFRGYKSGLIKIVAKLLSFLLAYAAAYFLAKPVSLLIQANLPISGLLSYVTAGFLIFIITSIIIWFISSKMIKQLDNESRVSNFSSISGAAVGAIIGISFGLMTVWFYSTIQELANANKGLPASVQSDFQQSVKKLTTIAVKNLVSGLSDNPDINAVSGALLSNPVENIERYKRINQSGQLQTIFHETASITALENRNPNQLMKTDSFKALIANPDFIALTQEFALPSEPKQMQKAVAEKMTTAWAQINQVKHDPQFVAITQDPEVRQMLQNKNIVALLNSPKVEALLKIVTSAKIPNLNFDETDNKLDNTNIPQQTKIIRWVDENGSVHYSDKPRKE